MSFLGFENYRTGYLEYPHFIAGVSKEGEGYLAFTIETATGELLGAQRRDKLEEALEIVNQLPGSRQFTPYSASGCGSGSCGSGSCDPLQCAKSSCACG